MFDGPKPKKVMKVDGAHESDLDISNDSKYQEKLLLIDGFQNELDALNEKGSEEILKVEQKYNKLRKPLFDKRNCIIKKIPQFWVTVFANHPTISTILTEEEEVCLRHLIMLEVEEFEDIKSGYRFKFYFEENPYLENDVIVKEFHLGSAGEPLSVSTDIRWKPGHDLNKIRRVVCEGKKRSALENQSFFRWFSDNRNPTNDEIADLIKDEVWLNPLDYFLIPDVAVENGVDEEVEEEEEEEDDEQVEDVLEEEVVSGEEVDGDAEEMVVEDSDEEVE